MAPVRRATAPRLLVLGAVLLPGAHGLVGAGRGSGFLAGRMQPEVAARTLADVVDEWRAQAAIFADCNASRGVASSVVDCNDATDSFQRSCSTVATSIVQASSGDKDEVKEYMGDVCGEKVLSGWRKERCSSLAQAIETAMTVDGYENRISFNAGKLCNSFWLRFEEAERARVAKEMAERQEQERLAAAAAAAAQKKAAEERAAEEKRLKEQAAKRIQAEMQAQAEASKKLLEAKKAEAEAVAQAAKQKAEEAATAEKHHQELQKKAAAAAQSTQKAPAQKKGISTPPKQAAAAKAKAKAPAQKKSISTPPKQAAAAKAKAKAPVASASTAAHTKSVRAPSKRAAAAKARPVAAKGKK